MTFAKPTSLTWAHLPGEGWVLLRRAKGLQDLWCASAACTGPSMLLSLSSAPLRQSRCRRTAWLQLCSGTVCAALRLQLPTTICASWLQSEHLVAAQVFDDPHPAHQPDAEFGCCKLVYGPDDTEWDDQALLRVDMGSTRGRARSLPLHLLLTSQDAIRCTQYAS